MVRHQPSHAQLNTRDPYLSVPISPLSLSFPQSRAFNAWPHTSLVSWLLVLHLAPYRPAFPLARLFSHSMVSNDLRYTALCGCFGACLPRSGSVLYSRALDLNTTLPHTKQLPCCTAFCIHISGLESKREREKEKAGG